MTDRDVCVAELKKIVRDFCAARGWDTDERPGQSAKSLAMSVAIEAAELMEIFQWCSTEQADCIKDDPKEFAHLQEELSDVLWYLLRIYTLFDIDVTTALRDKAEKNARRY